MDLLNATCVVTGAARGVGLALADALHRAQANVVLCDIDGEALAQAAARLDTQRIRCLRTDVRSSADLQRAANEATHSFGPPDLWINNAGLARHGSILEMEEAAIDQMLAVNLKGAILGSQIALRLMAPRRRGHILNIISTAALRGIPTETVYGATKWGLRGFTHGLAEEAAAAQVRVTALLPGGVDTAFWDDAAPGRSVPRQLFLSPADVAEAALALIALPDHAVPRELILRSMEDRDFA